MCFRPVLSSVLVAALVGCVPRHVPRIEVDRVPLGKVVVYRNGVAYYERRAQVEGGKLRVRVPRERVDDFLKSLTVVDARTQRPLPVAFPRQQADDAPVIDMQLDVGAGADGADVVMTYVTDAAAWKPSYRLVLDGDAAMLEGWAIVDNLSGEDWKDVVVGVGSSSAMSFRYDLWSVRTVEREQLASDAQFAVAPPTAVSPYGGSSAGASPNTNLLVLDAEEIRDVSNVPKGTLGAGIVQGNQGAPAAAGVTFSGASSVENRYVVDGINTTGGAPGPTATAGAIQGVVTDRGAGGPLSGVTVVVSGPGGQQVAITEEDGSYRIGALPPGTYLVTFYFGELVSERRNIVVGVNKATPVFQKLDTAAATQESIVIEDKPPAIDPSATSQGITIDREYTKSIPVGRTFQAVLGTAAGSQGDSYGTSFAAAPPPNPYAGVLIGDSKLARLVPELIKNRQHVVVEGYAAPGEPQPELRALDRANVVRNQLIDAGVSPGRVRAVGKGVGAGRASVQLVTEAAPTPEAAAGGPSPAAATTDDGPVGESHFDSGTTMTVGNGTSAMVSVLRATTTGQEVYLYDGDGERGNRRFAFKSVRLVNPTDATLEAGPVTVYGKGRYIGEGLTEPIGPHAAVVVPYALDRQIVVDREQEVDDELSQLQTVQRGILTAEVQHVRTTTLTLSSRLRAPATVYVRHAIEPGWELLDPKLAYERVGDAYLVQVELAAGASRTIELREATPLVRQLELGATSTLDMLQVYVASERPDATLKAQLAAILALHRKLFDTVDRIASLRDRQAEYRDRAAELEGQIVSLRKVKTAAGLSRELAAKAADISSRIQATTIAIVEAQEQVMLLRVEFQDALAELSLPDARVAAAAP